MDYIAIAKAFRKELEILRNSGQLPYELNDFPSGCCGTVSELLGDYLNTMHGLGCEYVLGTQGQKTHAWLEHDGIVIDITGDQFQGRPSVYVAEKDDWYLAWEISSRARAVHIRNASSYLEERELLHSVLAGAGLPNPDTL
ncbi:hypothetical protein LCGC14_0237030 [marine sediment metagenome]|uniref:Uncharacterized protein n=1 Tax=marine sediment metagenome TaxID=412755 RepID=A0A0F9WTF3_9ZZZZ